MIGKGQKGRGHGAIQGHVKAHTASQESITETIERIATRGEADP
jgi:hypothetical protein